MNVLVNAISIAEGGGLVVLTRLLEAVSRLEPDVNWYIAAEPQVLSLITQSKNIIGLPYSWVKKSPLHHLYWYEIILPRLVRQYKANICFSQTNFLPRRNLSCPSLLLVQHAGYFSDKFKQLYLQCYRKLTTHILWKQKNKWVNRSIKKATSVMVQTHALAVNIVDQLGISKNKLTVIPHGTGLLKETALQPKKFPANTIWRIGYITKFGVQKNFSTVFKAMQILKKNKIPIKLVLTLNEANIEFAPLLDQIRQCNIEDLIENHGEISDPVKITDLYSSLDLFLFPSLCESFGFTLVEAMASGLPLIVADTKSNCEIVSNAAEVFSSENEEQLAEKIQLLINDKEKYLTASQNSIERAKQFNWDNSAKNILQVMHQLTKESYEKK